MKSFNNRLGLEPEEIIKIYLLFMLLLLEVHNADEPIDFRNV